MDRLHRELLVRPAGSSKPFPQPSQILGCGGASAIISAAIWNWLKENCCDPIERDHLPDAKLTSTWTIWNWWVVESPTVSGGT
jgi:hypothetical protein